MSSKGKGGGKEEEDDDCAKRRASESRVDNAKRCLCLITLNQSGHHNLIRYKHHSFLTVVYLISTPSKLQR